MASEWNWRKSRECELCGNRNGQFRETFHGMTICVDSDSCTISRQRQGLITKTFAGKSRKEVSK